MGKLYPDTNQEFEIAEVAKLLKTKHLDGYQAGYAFIQAIANWSDPSLHYVLRWLMDDGLVDDTVYHDTLQAKAYYLYNLTYDRALRMAIERFDEVDVADSWGHQVDIGKARSNLDRVCAEVIR